MSSFFDSMLPAMGFFVGRVDTKHITYIQFNLLITVAWTSTVPLQFCLPMKSILQNLEESPRTGIRLSFCLLSTVQGCTVASPRPAQGAPCRIKNNPPPSPAAAIYDRKTKCNDEEVRRMINPMTGQDADYEGGIRLAF